MASLRWVADGIEVAERAGGITLDRHRRPGFTGRIVARPRAMAPEGAGSELPNIVDPEPDDDEDLRGGV